MSVLIRAAVNADDVPAAAVEAQGGTILMAPVEIPTVGRIVFFADPSGNAVGAINYIRNTP